MKEWAQCSPDNPHCLSKHTTLLIELLSRALSKSVIEGSSPKQREKLAKNKGSCQPWGKKVFAV